MTAVGEPGFEDLTAKARLRDSALRLFAERGIEATTIRDVAAAAGVSGGLVRHHFGSKDDLRAACDAFALEQLVRLKEAAVSGGRAADVGFMSSAHPRMLLLMRYVARSLLDGSPSADAMFSQLVGLTRDWLEAHHAGELSDPLAHAALLVSTEIGVLVMSAQLSRALGADIFQSRGQLRLARAKVELYSRPLLSKDVAAGALATIDQLQQEPKPKRRRTTRRAKP